MLIDRDDKTVLLNAWAFFNNRELMLSFLCANSGAADELAIKLSKIGVQSAVEHKEDSLPPIEKFRHFANNLPTYAIPLNENDIP